MVLLFAGVSAEARLNLPQKRRVVHLNAVDAQALKAEFGQASLEQRGLSPSARQVLLNNLPPDFRQACQEIVGSWGADLAGTEQWLVRLLHGSPAQVWLAFRCGSPRPDLSRYYDERLAALLLDSGKLEFLPLGQDYENDTTLYHVEFVEPLALEGAKAFVFRTTSSNDNPCCGGPEAISEQRMVVLYADSPQGFREVLSVLARREHNSHDDVEGDTLTLYQAEVKFERDSNNRVIAATASFREEVKGITWDTGAAQYHLQSQRSGTLRYRWNPATFRFEEVRKHGPRRTGSAAFDERLAVMNRCQIPQRSVRARKEPTIEQLSPWLALRFCAKSRVDFVALCSGGKVERGAETHGFNGGAILRGGKTCPS